MDLSDDDSEASGPTTSEVLLFLTLPASASPLSSSLMPRRHRERILEFTKTVTVTEVVNNSPQCHPGTCEVTVTNLDSGNGHPVSVNISHLHETVCQENGSGRCSPVVHVIESMEEGATVGRVEEISQRIEQYLRVETEGDVTFKRCGDNVIDLSFTTPVKPDVFSEIQNPEKTLYYHSLKEETATEATNDLISPDSAVSDSPERYVQSDDSDSDSGSMIIHSPVARPDSGVSSSVNRVLNRKNLSISVGSSEEDDLHFQGPSGDRKTEKNGRLPYYIVTSMSETVSSRCSPNTATFVADLDTSGTTATVMNNTTESESKAKYRKRGSEEKEKRRSILVVRNISSTPVEEKTTEDDSVDYYGASDWNESLPSRDRRRRITMEVLFTPPTPKDNGVPPKPPRRAKYGSNHIVEHVQIYEPSLDDMSEGPNMTSTPISTLERHAKKSVDIISEKDSKTFIESATEETPIMSTRKISKPPALKPFKPEQRELPLASPRRSPSSPIIVVDQNRRSSMDLLVPPKQPRRKSTITDIDWFAAFNMKEPTTPKSPRSPMAVDALREVENAVIEKKKPRTIPYEARPLAPSNISLDDIFACQNRIEKDDSKCTCNACAIMKMSEEELKMKFISLRRSPTTEKRSILVRSRSVEDEKTSLYADSDISLDDIFAPRKSKKEDPEHFKFYASGPAEAREASPVLSNNSHTEYHSITEFSSDNEFNSHNSHRQPSKPDISLDDVFQGPSSKEHSEEMEAKVSHQKLSSAYEVVRSTSASSRESIQLEVVHPADMERKEEVALDISLDDVFAPQTSTARRLRKEWTPRREPVQESTMYLTRSRTEEEKPKVKPAGYVDSDISLDDVFATMTSKNIIAEAASNTSTSLSSRSSSAESSSRKEKGVSNTYEDLKASVTAETNNESATSNEHESAASNKTKEQRNSTDQMAVISMDEIFAKQSEQTQRKLKNIFLPSRKSEQTTYFPFKRLEEAKQEQRPVVSEDSVISLDEVFNRTVPTESRKQEKEDQLNIDAVFERLKEDRRPSPPPEYAVSDKIQSSEDPSTPVVFVEHIEPQEGHEEKVVVPNSQEICLDEVFNLEAKSDSDSGKQPIDIEEVVFSEPSKDSKKPKQVEHKSAVSSAEVSLTKTEEKKTTAQPSGYVDSDISLDDVFATETEKQRIGSKKSHEEHGFCLEAVFAPKAPVQVERRSPPPDQVIHKHKPLLEEPAPVVFVEHQEPDESKVPVQQKDKQPIRLDDIFSTKQASEEKNNTDDIISISTEKEAKSETNVPGSDYGKTVETPNPKRPSNYVKSYSSLDDVFETTTRTKTQRHPTDGTTACKSMEYRKAKISRAEQKEDHEADISMDEVFTKTKPTAETIRHSSSPEADSFSQKRLSSEEKSAATPVQDVSWLEELLSPNPQPNEEELQGTVRKLHDEVHSNEQSTNKQVLNDTVESGYTSLDRSKSSADRPHVVSFPDYQVDLDTVFSPIRSDSHEIQTRKSKETFISRYGGQKHTERLESPVRIQSGSDTEEGRHIIPSEKYRVESSSKSRVAVESRKESFSEIRNMREPYSSASSSQSGETPINQLTASSNDFSWIKSVIQSEEAASQPQTTSKTTEVTKSLQEVAIGCQSAKSSSATNEKASASEADLNWIRNIIEESKKTAETKSKTQTDDSYSDEDILPAEDIIEKVFGAPCDSEKGKTCTCSACQLTKMSTSELKEFWKGMKKQETKTIPPTDGNGSSTIISKDDRTESLEATVDFEDVFGRKSKSAPEKPETELSAESEETIVDRNELRDASLARPVAPQKTDGQRSVLADDVPFMVDLNDIFPALSTSAKEEKVEKKTADSRKTKKQNRKHIEEQCFSVHKETANTGDSWIQDIIGNDVTEQEEADTFETSYLQSIKETQSQNMDEASSYNNYYRLQTAVTQKHHSMRHVDDYYDEPEDDEVSVEDIDVGDLVDDILSSSMNEAVFRVAAKNYSREEAHHTDTSVDRKTELQQQIYLSTAASDNRLESVLSYPPSTSSPTTPHSMNSEQKFISEASVMLSDPADEDYFMRLIFANHEAEQPVMANLSSQVVTESEVVTPSDNASNFYGTCNTRVVQSERHSQHTMTKTDEEILEVEVNQENFIIKGNYAIVINKHDPLGVLLSELTSNSSALDFSVTPKIRRLLLQCLKEKAKPSIGNSLSSRAREILCRTDPAYKVFYQMQEQRYTKENIMGNINLCTAENNLCNELVEERFRQHPELFVPDYKHIIHYGPPGGHPEIKSVLCEYLRNEHGGDVQEELLVLLPSGNATYDLLCHCLFDSDDVILTNTPTYSRNFVNVSDRAQCHLAPVDFDLHNPRINVAAYERAFVERTEQGENVKAVIVINPHNPMGIVHSAEELTELAHWAEEKGLWLLVDESFSQCVHNCNAEFTSFLALQMKLPVKSVWFWSLSKDFGLPGIRLSMAHTNNRDLHYALGQLELTEPVSSLAQDFVSNFLSDKQWLSSFKNEKLRRIRAHYKFVAENLDNLGIPYTKATAGIFVFVDFRKKISSNSLEGEEELFNSLTAKGIFMTPGSHCKCSQPGWMRLVFACDKEQLYEAFRRFYEFFNSHSSIVGEINY